MDPVQDKALLENLQKIIGYSLAQAQNTELFTKLVATPYLKNISDNILAKVLAYNSNPETQ
jgi:hypothetical protein